MRLTDNYETRRLYTDMIKSNFKEGDWIESGGVEGQIVHMNWRTVTIETLDDEKLVVIPNSTLASEPFTVLTTSSLDKR